LFGEKCPLSIERVWKGAKKNTKKSLRKEKSVKCRGKKETQSQPVESTINEGRRKTK